jgi:ion channel-forming bestrophin family protein
VIDYEAGNWQAIVGRVRGTVLPKLFWRVLLAGVVGVLASWLWSRYRVKIPSVLHTLIGVALGLLLVFRTNASYDRYWEGRKLLGGMVNRARDLVRQVVTVVGGVEEAACQTRVAVQRYVGAFFGLAMQALRDERDLEVLDDLLTAEERADLGPVRHRAPVVLTWISRRLAAHRPAIGDLDRIAMDANLTHLIDCLGGCERIRRTPVPFAYAHHIKLFVVLFCYSAPFAMVESMEWYTGVAAVTLAFALFGIDEIGVEIEDPFGYDPNDLPIDRIQATIQQSTAEILERG